MTLTHVLSAAGCVALFGAFSASMLIGDGEEQAPTPTRGAVSPGVQAVLSHDVAVADVSDDATQEADPTHLSDFAPVPSTPEPAPEARASDSIPLSVHTPVRSDAAAFSSPASSRSNGGVVTEPESQVGLSMVSLKREQEQLHCELMKVRERHELEQRIERTRRALGLAPDDPAADTLRTLLGDRSSPFQLSTDDASGDPFEVFELEPEDPWARRY